MSIQTAFDFSTSSDDYGWLYVGLDMDGRGYVKPGRTQNIVKRAKDHRRTGFALEIQVYISGHTTAETNLHNRLKSECPESLVAGREYYSIWKANNPALFRAIVIESLRPYCKVDPERQALDRLEVMLAALVEEIATKKWLDSNRPYDDGYR